MPEPGSQTRQGCRHFVFLRRMEERSIGAPAARVNSRTDARVDARVRAMISSVLMRVSAVPRSASSILVPRSLGLVARLDLRISAQSSANSNSTSV